MIRLIAIALLAVCTTASVVAQAGTLHRGLGPAPGTLDMHRAQGLAAFNLLRDLHEGLLTRDASGRPVPAIARDWRVSPDGLDWRFTLDPDARWSDGEPITASDFVRGFARARDPETASPTAGWLEPVAEVRAADAHELIIRLHRRVPWFEELLTLPVSFPWPDGKREVYSGAFRLVRRVPGARFELERNPHYRDVDSVDLRGVTWHVTEDPSAELARFRAGELHITESVPPGRHKWLVRELGDSLRIAPYLGSFYLVFNLSRPPFADDEALREALSLAIDRKLIAERVIGTGELPAWRLVPPGLEDWPDEPPAAARLSDDERIDKARRLLARSGFDRDRTIELRFNSSLAHRRLAAAVAAMWKQHLGVSTSLVNEEWKVFVTNRRQGRITEIVRGGWIADWADPANFLANFHTSSPLNYAFFSDPTFDRLLDRAENLDGRQRLRTLRQAEERLLDRNVVIPLYYYVSRHLVRPVVEGYRGNPMDIHLSRWMRLDPAGARE
ncbi:MAG: peptide ABC transporter substrate-binding protein [Candidatus Wenzhouxiangella sp. M2_3B_020]